MAMLWVRTFDDPKPALGRAAVQADLFAVPGTGAALFKLMDCFMRASAAASTRRASRIPIA
ncbi:hypothetical protein [Rhodospirillaceae bacterium SYSU D60014]|uniref:hypothetical protein n=1 Tax=Virgifigura deserti TaxID=2268457 RepID=UPI000E673E18